MTWCGLSEKGRQMSDLSNYWIFLDCSRHKYSLTSATLSLRKAIHSTVLVQKLVFRSTSVPLNILEEAFLSKQLLHVPVW